MGGKVTCIFTRTNGTLCQVAVVGGGAGGVELAMSVHYRLHAELAAAGRKPEGCVTVKWGDLESDTMVLASPWIGNLIAVWWCLER